MLSLYSHPECKLHPEKWQPDEADKPRIIKKLHEYYFATLDMCGPNDEFTQESFALYMKVNNRSLSECKKDIQEFFWDMYQAVNGEIEEFYGDDTKLIDLINLTLCPEAEDSKEDNLNGTILL